VVAVGRRLAAVEEDRADIFDAADDLADEDLTEEDLADVIVRP
jgi:hypothetical protein